MLVTVASSNIATALADPVARNVAARITNHPITIVTNRRDGARAETTRFARAGSFAVESPIMVHAIDASGHYPAKGIDNYKMAG